MFPIAKINGKKYMDGGIADSVPFARAIEAGCDKIIVILSREKSYVKGESKSEKLSSVLFRKYPHFADALRNRSKMYNSQRDALFKLEKEGKAFVIAPENTSGWKRTENDGAKIKEMYDEGYSMGKSLVPSIKEYLENKE